MSGTDFSTIGLDQYMQSLDSPISTSDYLSAITQDNQFEFNPFLYGNLLTKGALGVRQQITLVSAGASGGAQASLFTSAGTPQGVDASRVLLDPADYPGAKFFLEANYRAGKIGEAARTFYMDFYDITGGSAVANGTFTGTAQAGTSGYGQLPRGRSVNNFHPSLPVGKREYMVRYWGTSTSGTLFVDLYQARLIIDFSGTAGTV